MDHSEKLKKIEALFEGGKKAPFERVANLLIPTSMPIAGAIGVKGWVHPFVESLSDAIVEDLENGIAWIRELLVGKVEAKGIESIRDAMDYYQKTQLSKDLPMKEIFEREPTLRKKVVQNSK